MLIFRQCLSIAVRYLSLLFILVSISTPAAPFKQVAKKIQANRLSEFKQKKIKAPRTTPPRVIPPSVIKPQIIPPPRVIPSISPGDPAAFNVKSGTRVLYVSPAGLNSNSGLLESAPLKTIQYAMDLSKPGDTVLVMNGTYSHKDYPFGDIVTIQNSGNENAWITLKAFPGHTPLLSSINWSAIKVQANYILVEGFTIVGNRDDVTLDYALAEKSNTNNPTTSGNGIAIAPPYDKPTIHPHHVIVRNNQVSKCSGGGIGTMQADYVLIENNVVSGNGYWAPYGNSGISVYQSWNSDSTTGYKMIVRGNTAFGNFNKIPFVFSDPDPAKRVITDGNGIIVDDARNTQNFNGTNGTPKPYLGRTLVDSNLVYENGARGINVFSSDHVDVIHNTTYHNSIQNETPDGEITLFSATDIRVYNNIFVARDDRPTTSRLYAADPKNAAERNSQSFVRNIVFGGLGFDANAAGNLVGVNPQFNNAKSYDFTLATASPAIDGADLRLSFLHALAGAKRPLGKGPDIGAYEIR